MQSKIDSFITDFGAESEDFSARLQELLDEARKAERVRIADAADARWQAERQEAMSRASEVFNETMAAVLEAARQ